MRSGAKLDDLLGVLWLGAPHLHPSAAERSAAWRGSARYVLLAVWAIRSASAARMTLRSNDATEAPACFAVARQ